MDKHIIHQGVLLENRIEGLHRLASHQKAVEYHHMFDSKKSKNKNKN
jgi:hypothetical protein